jgi:hypothetical protein
VYDKQYRETNKSPVLYLRYLNEVHLKPRPEEIPPIGGILDKKKFRLDEIRTDRRYFVRFKVVEVFDSTDRHF